MKALAFKDNAAVIAGHRVPYSLLGAAAAILGAFLIWKFNQSGGLGLGTAPTTDPLASLLGNAYTPTDYTTPPGSTAGFAGGGSYPSSPAYVTPTIDYGPPSSSYYSGATAGAPVPVSSASSASPTSRTFLEQVQAAFSPIAPQLGGLLPGILTPAVTKAVAITPPPPSTPVGSATSAIGGYFQAVVSRVAQATPTASAPAPAPAPVAAVTKTMSGRAGGNAYVE
jgi:hypothetical protein